MNEDFVCVDTLWVGLVKWTADPLEDDFRLGQADVWGVSLFPLFAKLVNQELLDLGFPSVIIVPVGQLTNISLVGGLSCNSACYAFCG